MGFFPDIDRATIGTQFAFPDEPANHRRTAVDNSYKLPCCAELLHSGIALRYPTTCKYEALVRSGWLLFLSDLKGRNHFEKT